MNDLERRYRLLLLAFPRRYRARRGEEILGTLMEAAGPNRCWPTLGEAVDLVDTGLQARTGLSARSPLGSLLGLAAPYGARACGRARVGLPGLRRAQGPGHLAPRLAARPVHRRPLRDQRRAALRVRVADLRRDDDPADGRGESPCPGELLGRVPLVDDRQPAGQLPSSGRPAGAAPPGRRADRGGPGRRSVAERAHRRDRGSRRRDGCAGAWAQRLGHPGDFLRRRSDRPDPGSSLSRGGVGRSGYFAYWH